MGSRSARGIYAETLAVFDRSGGDFEPLTTPEVADALGANRRTVYKRLRKLVDEGELETKETGSNSRVWWRPPAETPAAPASPDGDTDRRECEHADERELEETNRQLEAVLDTVEAAIFIKDVEGRYQLMNEECKRLLGLDPDVEVVGLTDDDLFPESAAEDFRADDRRVLEQRETVYTEEEVPTARGTRTSLTVKSPLAGPDGALTGVCAVSTDITARKEREQRLQTRSTAMEASIDGIAILDANGEYVFVNRAHVDTYGYDDPDAFLGETWRMCYDEDELVRIENEVMPTLYEDGAWRGELTGQRKDGTTFPQELSLTVTDDGGVVCVVRDITDRTERERELERQRGQLAALNELSGVVREITETVIDQSTRSEIEEAVCDRLAESDSYRFAWICGIDSGLELEPRAEAGVDGYLEEIPLSVDPDDPTGGGPTGRAVRTQEMQITQNARAAAEFEPWHGYAREYGYRSSAAIPIVDEGTLYGVIGVYSERPEAFAEEEREVIGQLGEIVGHAIAAVDRKRALMNEEVVELEFRMRGIEVHDLPTLGDDTVVFDRTVPLGDGSYLEYGIATGDAMETVSALVESDATPHSGPVNVIDSRGDETRFEARLIDPPMLSTVVARGGYFDEVRIDDRGYHITTHLPPGTDVGAIIDAIRDAYPGVKVVTRRQRTRPDGTPQQLMDVLADRLTERPRAALEGGYFAGFFEWPRAGSGEDVAESLDIGASTFHQHLRKAERKLLEVVFEEA